MLPPGNYLRGTQCHSQSACPIRVNATDSSSKGRRQNFGLRCARCFASRTLSFGPVPRDVAALSPKQPSMEEAFYPAHQLSVIKPILCSGMYSISVPYALDIDLTPSMISRPSAGEATSGLPRSGRALSNPRSSGISSMVLKVGPLNLNIAPKLSQCSRFRSFLFLAKRAAIASCAEALSPSPYLSKNSEGKRST